MHKRVKQTACVQYAWIVLSVTASYVKSCVHFGGISEVPIIETFLQISLKRGMIKDSWIISGS